MKPIVITIARQYGSGGRSMALMLAEELGIPLYDRDLNKVASEMSGISEALFGDCDEKVKTGFFRGKPAPYTGHVLSPDDKDYTSPENLFAIQAQTIKHLAETESCVIMGRCADYVLRDYDNVLSVYIHADEDFCLARAKEKLSMPEKEIQAFIHKTDRERAEYYHAYTGREWSDARNYDLCLDSGKLGYEKCIRMIKGYMSIRFN